MRIRPDLASKVIIHFPYIPDLPRYNWQEPIGWHTTIIPTMVGFNPGNIYVSFLNPAYYHWDNGRLSV